MLIRHNSRRIVPSCRFDTNRALHVESGAKGSDSSRIVLNRHGDDSIRIVLNRHEEDDSSRIVLNRHEGDDSSRIVSNRHEGGDSLPFDPIVKTRDASTRIGCIGHVWEVIVHLHLTVTFKLKPT